MNLKIQSFEDKLIIHMIGELDHHSAEEVRNRIDASLDRENCNKLVMDFSGVTFMDSSGIGMVIGRYKKISLKKGSICITNVNSNIKKVLELSGMFKIIKLFDSVEQALANI